MKASSTTLLYLYVRKNSSMRVGQRQRLMLMYLRQVLLRLAVFALHPLDR